MRRAAKWGAGFIVVAVAGIQGFGPEPTNPPIDAGRTIERHHPPTPTAAAALERACRDCHSNRTEWPWYSHVAPVSWFVIDHVNHGRTHLNFSEWSTYSPDRAEELLRHVCKEVSGGTMPLASYTWVHRSARLTADDVRALCDWSRAEASRRHGSENPAAARSLLTPPPKQGGF